MNTMIDVIGTILTAGLLACIAYKLLLIAAHQHNKQLRRERVDRRLDRMVKDDRIKATVRRVLPRINVLAFTLVHECSLQTEHGTLTPIPVWESYLEVRFG